MKHNEREIEERRITEKGIVRLIENIPSYMGKYGNFVSYTARLMELCNQPDTERNNPEIRMEYANAVLMNLEAYQDAIPKDIGVQVLNVTQIRLVNEYCQLF